jgi:hypothetical protein
VFFFFGGDATLLLAREARVCVCAAHSRHGLAFVCRAGPVRPPPNV